MYTQCPECSTAFRVTADVLKQAAGKVRCGSCGNAFNALDYLSETMPDRQPKKEIDEQLPELKPEPLPGERVSISAEQSAALLKTLDELAGSDIRIEDTGVEWRVLDDDELGEAASDDIAMDIDVEDQPEIDEILEDSPTPVDQFLTDTPPEVDSPEIFAEGASDPARTPVEELRFDDNTPLPEDFDLDEVFRSPTGENEPPAPSESEPDRAAAPQVDPDLSEPDEWADILDEFEELVDDLAEDEVDEKDKAPLDVDAQFALQAEAMGIDLSGMHETLGAPAAEDAAESDVDDLEMQPRPPEAEDCDSEALLAEEIVEEADTRADHEPVDEAHDHSDTPDDGVDDQVVEADADDVDDGEDDAAAAQLDLIEEAEDDSLGDEARDQAPDDQPPIEHYVPPMTKEEETINMQIDQDLLAIAVEDKDGLASTMLLMQDALDGEATNAGDDHDPDAEEDTDLADTSAGFETIIMEGEFIRSGDESGKFTVDAAAAAALTAAVAAEKEAEDAAGKRQVNYGMVAGVVILLLLLVGQAVHQSRHALATIPAFNDTVGPLYRAIGQPLSPDWDITGWRFEASRGNADEANEALTIFSRLGNKSDRPLPYPLISVSLTDRFEETIGNRVLDPADYLPNDLDPRKLVEPGNTFNAAITIQSPADEATGFKLNVCYREPGDKLRCAIDDFK